MQTILFFLVISLSVELLLTALLVTGDQNILLSYFVPVRIYHNAETDKSKNFSYI